LRTLELPETIPDQGLLFSTIAGLSHCFIDEQSAGAIVRKVREMLVSHDLPFEIWPNPFSDVELWKKYIQQYESLQLFAKEIVFGDLGIKI